MTKETVLSDNPDDNYQRFFEEAVDMGCIWGLQNKEGWALCESEKYPETSVIPFWSQPEYAKVHCKDEWSNYEVIAISLEEFLDDWLTGMHEDVLLVGVNWNNELEGGEYEPLDILHEFDELLQ